MNSKRLWRLVIVLALALAYGGSTEEAPSAQGAGRQVATGGQVAKITAPPEMLVVWFNPAGRIVRVLDAAGNVKQPVKRPKPTDKILNTVFLVEGSHCIWDNGELYCSTP